MDAPVQDPVSWDLIGIGVAALLGLLVSVLGMKKTVVPPVQPGPSTAQQDADKKEVAGEKKAQEDHDVQVVADEKKHDEDVAAVVKDIEKKTEEIRNNPLVVNTTLIDIGKDVRGGRS